MAACREARTRLEARFRHRAAPELPDEKRAASVSCMETEGRKDQPSAAEAEQLLSMANRESQRTANPPLPWSFFVAQAGLLAAVCAAQVLEGSISHAITIFGLALIVVLGVRNVFYRAGYGVVWPDGQSIFPYLVAGFTTVGLPAILAIGFGIDWPWLVSAVGAAGTTLVMGSRYRKVAGLSD